MTYAAKLQYAGADPFAREAERLPYPVFEALTNGADDIGLYEELAEVRWLAGELENDVAGNPHVHEETRAHLFRAVADTDAPLQVAVDAYIADWLSEHAATLITDWEIDPALVAEACAEYEVSEADAEVAIDAT